MLDVSLVCFISSVYEKRITFAAYEFDRDEADVVNRMASLVKG